MLGTKARPKDLAKAVPLLQTRWTALESNDKAARRWGKPHEGMQPTRDRAPLSSLWRDIG